MAASAGTGVFQLTTTGFQGGRAGPGRKPTRALYTAVASVDKVGDTISSGPGFGSSTCQHFGVSPCFVGDWTLPLSTNVFAAPAATQSRPWPTTLAMSLSPT